MDAAPVLLCLRGLQDRIVAELAAFDGKDFRTDSWQRPEGGGGLTRLIEEPTAQLYAAAGELQFELAARLRDEVSDLKRELRGMREAGTA